MPELHLAHTERLPWLDSLVTEDVTHQLGAVALYEVPSQVPTTPPSSVTPSVALAVREVRLLTTVAGEAVDVGLDGSYAHTVDLVAPCESDITVTANGSRAACSTLQGVEMFSAANDATAPYPGLVLPNALDGSDNIGAPSWSPDGSLLMVRHGSMGNGEIQMGSRLSIYRLPNIGSPQLLLDLRFVELAVNENLWSPDGNWLLVDGSTDGMHFQPYVYGMMPWLPALRAAAPGAPPLSVTVTNDQLTPLNGKANGPYAWRPRHGAEKSGQEVVTFVGDDQQAVIQRTLPSPAETVLFTQHVGLICGLAWTPDGSGLVFQLCGPAGDNTPGPPAHLYLYEPPAGT